MTDQCDLQATHLGSHGLETDVDYEAVYKRRLIRVPPRKPKTAKQMHNELVQVAKQYSALEPLKS